VDRFVGNGGSVERAFHTEIHQYVVKGEHHVANATEISVPQALTPVIKGVLSLHNFEKRPLHNDGFKVRRDSETGKLVPEFTFTDSNGIPFHFLAPGDFSRIYNTLSLLNAGISGMGTSIRSRYEWTCWLEKSSAAFCTGHTRYQTVRACTTYFMGV
jgi:large repetitive protein